MAQPFGPFRKVRPNPVLARPGVRGTFSQPGPSHPAAGVRLARTLGVTNTTMRLNLPRDIFLFTLATSSVFWLWSNWITQPPLRERVNLSSTAYKNYQVHLRVPQTHKLELEFLRSGRPHEDMLRLVGHMGLCGGGAECGKGDPLTVEWELLNADGTKIIEKHKTVTSDASGFSSAEVFRNVAEIQVPPNTYILKVRFIEPSKELASVETKLALAILPKDTQSWQMATVRWGTLLLPFGALPIAIASGLLWLTRRDA